ncbi:hypothetical protein [Nocardia abscessus]|nr:hypothetical protein [Nocardia abscessus]
MLDLSDRQAAEAVRCRIDFNSRARPSVEASPLMRASVSHQRTSP